MRLRFTHAPILLLWLILAAGAAVAQNVPAYVPLPVAVPKNAPYVLSDGSIYIVAGESMGDLLAKVDELFIRSHPGFKFKVLAKGDASAALAAINAGVSAFALVDREAWPLEVRPFRQAYGYEPTEVRIGYVGYCAPGRIRPPSVYINKRNPLTGLTVEQVASIFTTGGGTADLTHWSQLGLGGEWAGRVIHIYGPRDDGSFASSLRHAAMGGRPFAARYEPLSDNGETIRAVAEDPYGIALVGPYEADALPSSVKAIPLAQTEGGPFSTAKENDVLAGKYPFSTYLRLYVNRVPGKPLDAFLKEYARLLLSREAQRLIATQKDIGPGYLPLSATELATELAKLDAGRSDSGKVVAK